MKTLQRGFTLIELMIVVAIIGIIVALAVPAYQDYTLRSRISEAGSLSSAVRTAIDVQVSEGYTLGGLLTTPISIGLATNAASYRSKYVASVGYAQGGAVTATLSTHKSLGSEGGNNVIYSPIQRGGNLHWIVSSGSSVTLRYRPKP